ncbi:ABC transporter substrate-binding protein [Modestobacter sp. I12A-02628]|uniref:ABC transporter substrate-binding protein n=1 Tax=Goekera deserti TaxID=2497753 RepID=A0A7K3W8D5_9ACTN|nr:ABC transporter substrate-binding protein [Goekera deserti]MPR00285.1 ABC transporter substrate-binding protein [Goekera deserti]NDI49459.1 ABC transporter substrate-binding protein [Goekera deserti]NEL52667.1 ABC transporter substrate-binding protein [Goekera deserti]
MHRSSRLTARLAVVGALVAGLTACGGSDDTAPAAGSSSSGAFPVSIDTKFGTTEIPAEPERVVTVGFNDQDFVLALGVTPVGERENLGDYDATARPWAQDLLPAEEIPTVGAEEIDLEAVAALQPDLIVGVYSFIDRATYYQLAKIAPTLAQTGEHPDGATPWQEQTLLTGQALGREDEAQALVDDVEGRFAQAVADNPGFTGSSMAVDLTGVGSGHYLLGADDLRTQFFADLGFTVPDASTDVSPERLDLLEADVLAVNGYDHADADADALFSALDVVTQRRTVLLGGYAGDVSAALGFGSPLSLPFLLDRVVPALAAAADGDPATPVPALT